ncbi:DNA mismatch repair endonuclease MutH [Colwellia sp. 4_MG-2023]|jgi:DNA mismatch repair protein MutH|uniref:DNA mismatch repair endonuclease MutH n=1 Tax=unclassified Colwellia TaxID=196834 RepID=UPI0026E11674|nr:MULTISPECIES: DNA mismatch repair endonuclease MutH [unclassified Colwellia]MDO6507683.1 DNA mismatch repair endonuclease MutH [Colwellia sp. 5_MG-2023]MDO6555679.1 DNA mismatch repair endonuclease MutH [Colwellia sp. 4_MG-2023]
MNIPASEQELLERVHNLAGLTLAEVAYDAKIEIPVDLKRNKGWIGLLLEHVLGASASSKPEPDFPTLGIELKTLPINCQGKPLETTFVCVAPLTGLVGVNWQNCWLKQKLSKVLWVPIICDTPDNKKIPLAERRIGSAFLWSPSAEEEQLLAMDWQELTDMIVLGDVENIHGKHGQVLQLRPKAANAKAKTQAYNRHGKPFMTLPRGFYLKIPFTQALLNKNLRINIDV